MKLETFTMQFLEKEWILPLKIVSIRDPKYLTMIFIETCEWRLPIPLTAITMLDSLDLQTVIKMISWRLKTSCVNFHVIWDLSSLHKKIDAFSSVFVGLIDRVESMEAHSCYGSMEARCAVKFVKCFVRYYYPKWQYREN